MGAVVATLAKPTRVRRPARHRSGDVDSEHEGSHGVGDVLRLQRLAGNSAVANVLGSATALPELMSKASQLIGEAIASGVTAYENELTNKLFWAEYPQLQGQKLKAKTPEALRWIAIRDKVVRPMLRAPKPAAAPGPALEPVAKAEATANEGTDRTGDAYFEQSGGRYQHTDAKGVVQVWLYGASGFNVCNMTTLTMSLVSMVGEDELRARLVKLLQTGGFHTGAAVQVGGKWVPLGDALADPKISARVKLIDLATAAAIGTTGGYKTVTEGNTIAALAKATGIATKSQHLTKGAVDLTTAKAQQRAKDLLASGARVIAGTVGHYVYLLDINDAGALVHDPAGARVNPTKGGVVFLHTGGISRIASEYSRASAAARARAMVRLSKNPKLLAVLQRVDEVVKITDAKERAAALKQAQKDFPGTYELGASNFYAASEFKENSFRLRVSISN